MDDKYILTFFSEYLNCREKFIYSRVSKLWNEGMKKGKKEFIVKEVEKMLRDIEVHNCNGILVSQSSGIAQKNDFEIQITFKI